MGAGNSLDGVHRYGEPSNQDRATTHTAPVGFPDIVHKSAEAAWRRTMKTSSRNVNGVEIIKLEGKITIGAGDTQLRDVISNTVKEGKNQILLDMREVTTIDSSGIGELVGAYTTVTNRGGKLKLLRLPPKVSDLLQVTQLITVFEVYEDEKDAVNSF